MVIMVTPGEVASCSQGNVNTFTRGNVNMVIWSSWSWGKNRAQNGRATIHYVYIHIYIYYLIIYIYKTIKTMLANIARKISVLIMVNPPQYHNHKETTRQNIFVFDKNSC